MAAMTALDANGPVPPECLDDEPYPTDWRWSCPKCGRFIAESAIRSEDHRDDSTYYGISTEYAAKCAKCGDVDPHWAPTRWVVPK